MGDLILTVALVVSVVIVGWVAWRVGHDTAAKQAFYTISELRRTVRGQQLEIDRVREHNRILTERLQRSNVIVPEVPQWMR